MSSTTRSKAVRDGSLDDYGTPWALSLAAVRCLVADGHTDPRAVVLEPSCGSGSWINALRECGFDLKRIHGIDLRKWAVEQLPCKGTVGDFLKQDVAGKYNLIVGNPPFNDADAHVRHALGGLAPGGVLAFLLRFGWFTAEKPQRDVKGVRVGDSRRDLVWGVGPRCNRPVHIYIVMPRPSFTGDGQDSATYCVAVWRAIPSPFPTTVSPLFWQKDTRRI